MTFVPWVAKGFEEFGTAAVAAAWMVSTALNGAPHFKTTPLTLEMAALSQSGSERIITAFADLAAAPVRSNDAAAPAPPAVEPRAAEAEFQSAAAAAWPSPCGALSSKGWYQKVLP